MKPLFDFCKSFLYSTLKLFHKTISFAIFFHYYPYKLNITAEECDTQVFMISRKQKTQGIFLGSSVFIRVREQII
jgi:hypothetical protein